MAEWQLENLHLIVTSRNERGVEVGLKSYVEHTIYLQSEFVDSDIQLYVQQRLSDDKTLMKWGRDAGIRHEIETALIHRARGMYEHSISLRRCRTNNDTGSGGLHVSSIC